MSIPANLAHLKGGKLAGRNEEFCCQQAFFHSSLIKVRAADKQEARFIGLEAVADFDYTAFRDGI
jgi:hypothetical protein